MRENYREFTSLETKEERIDRITSLYRFAFICFVLILIVALVTGVFYFFILPPDPPLKTGTTIKTALVFRSPRGQLMFICVSHIIFLFGMVLIYAINKRIKTYKILKQRYMEKKGEKPKISLIPYVFGTSSF